MLEAIFLDKEIVISEADRSAADWLRCHCRSAYASPARLRIIERARALSAFQF